MEIHDLHLAIQALCARHGISLYCWQEIVTTMLEKDPGRPKHCLRVIHLLEADLNLLIKILLACCFVWHAEDHQAFGEAHRQAPAQADRQSSRKSSRYHDLAARTLYNQGMMEHDATTGFIRMTPSLVMISLRAYGIPYSTTTAFHWNYSTEMKSASHELHNDISL
jgi:hypothetical protein